MKPPTRRRGSSSSPASKFKGALSGGLALWQTSGTSNGTTTRAPLHVQSSSYLPPPRRRVPPPPAMEEQLKQKPHDDKFDLPRSPELTLAMEERLDVLDKYFASAAGDIAKCRKQILSRRSKLFESVDPVLLVLKLLPQELSNVHTCVRQALSYNFLTDASKGSFEADVMSTIKELAFSLQHLNITERNGSVDRTESVDRTVPQDKHRKKLTYRAIDGDYNEWEAFAVNDQSNCQAMKQKLKEDFALGDNLQRATQGVEMCLRNLTKTRIRYKRLLYEAMEDAMMRDEAENNSGVSMDVLLHPSWN